MSRRARVAFLLSLAVCSVSAAPLRPVRDAEPEATAPTAAGGDPVVDAVAAHLGDHARALVPEEIAPLAEAIVAESRLRGFSPSLVLAMIEVESQFDPFGVSPVGAVGLMQVLPTTAAALAPGLGIEWRGTRPLFDPVANLRIGLAYLEQMRERFDHLPTALAAYNWGPSAIVRRVRRGAPIPEAYSGRVLSAYAETSLAPMTSS